MDTQGDPNILASKGFDPAVLGEFIRTRFNDGERQFVTFLVGAGFSCSAGVPSAGQIVSELRGHEKTHPLLRNAGAPPQGVSEYAYLMDKLGSPSERAKWVKKFVDRAKESGGRQRLKINWAHLLLASMVDKGLVKRILTTNFDPLIVEALALTGQPIRTYDLNTTGHYSPGTLDSGSVIYLHGQMHSLFLANSPAEMERVSKLYPGVLQDAIQGSILIVVGYSGECDPVLQSLEKLPSFPDGLWWSHFSTKGRLPCADVAQLFNKHSNSCHISAGDDADTFMRKLVLDGIKLELPGVVLAPFKTADETLGRITSFPVNDTTGGGGGDPVTSSRELLRRASEEQGLVELSEVVSAQMASLISDRETLEKMARLIQPNPKARISQALGDAYCKTASRTLEADELDDGLKCLESAQVYGVSESTLPWVPVLFGIAFSDLALREKNVEKRNALFEKAENKFKEAVTVKAGMFEAYYNWGICLAHRAGFARSSVERKHLYKKSSSKYEIASQARPKDHAMLNNWGLALTLEGMEANEEQHANGLLVEGINKFEETACIKPDCHEAFYNWGNALSKQAQLKINRLAADSLFDEAGKKYAEALRIMPNKFKALVNWGIALAIQAESKKEPSERNSLFAAAREKFSEAARVDPDDCEAFINWGTALFTEAKVTEDLARACVLYSEAGQKYAEASRIGPDTSEAYCGWGCALLELARLKLNETEFSGLISEAEQKFEMAEKTKNNAFEPLYHLAVIAAMRGETLKCCNRLVQWKQYHPNPKKKNLDSESDFNKVRGTAEFQSFRNSLLE